MFIRVKSEERIKDQRKIKSERKTGETQAESNEKKMIMIKVKKR